MTQILITSSNENTKHTLNRILSNALERERKILLAAIDKTQSHLTTFEKKYSKSSAQFFALYQQGEEGDSDDTIDWAGEYNLYLNLKNKLNSLEDVVVENK